MKGSKYQRKAKQRPQPKTVKTCPCGWKGEHGRNDMPDYCPACGAYLKPKRRP